MTIRGLVKYPPEDSRTVELRCKECRKLLLEGVISGKFTAQCPRCGRKNTYCISIESGRIFGREVEARIVETS